MDLNLKSRKDLVKIINEFNLKIGCEIGVRTGNFSRYLLENSDLDVLYSIDPFKDGFPHYAEGSYELAKKILRNFSERSVIIREASFDCVNKFQDNYFDFIYIDAGHDYGNVKRDLDLFYPKLKIGGIFSGHDYCDAQPDVKTVVNEFQKNTGLQLFITGISEDGFSNINGEEAEAPSWIFLKK